MIDYDMLDEMNDNTPKREKIVHPVRMLSDRQCNQRQAENRINRALIHSFTGKE